MIRVLVVEDSATMRHHLREALAADPELQVVGEAVDGGQAVELVGRLRPDVVTMDMMLPTMSGLAATEHIMAECPTPILVVSSADRQELFSTYNALAAGAVDVLEKPRGDDSDAGLGAPAVLGRAAGVADPGDHPPAGPARRPHAAPRAAAGAPRRVARHGRAAAAARRPAGGGGRRLDRRARRARPTCCGRCRPVSVRPCCACSTSRRASRSRWPSPTGSAGQTGRDVSYAQRRHAAARASAGGSCSPRRTGTCWSRDGVVRLSDAPPRHSCRPVGGRAVRVGGRRVRRRPRPAAC